MPSDKEIIAKLNDIRSRESRMALIYKQFANLVTGPYRLSLVEEFDEHAQDELKHADYAMQRIMAMGGDIDQEIMPLPSYRNLRDLLNGLAELEEEGIKAWQELMEMLPKNDSFIHVIESVLETETEHYNEAKLYIRDDYNMSKSWSNKAPKPLNWVEPTFANDVVKIHRPSYEAEMYKAKTGGNVNIRIPQNPNWDLSPPVPESINPTLLVKATRRPVVIKETRKPQFGKIRDDHGRFAKVGSTETESTSIEDAEKEEREAKSAIKENLKRNKVSARKLRLQERKLNKGIPNIPQSMSMSEDDNSDILGYTQSGKNIYEDPYHPNHSNFNDQDHNDAADLRDYMANSGDESEALDHQTASVNHRELANDAMSPMKRANQNQKNNNGIPGLQMSGNQFNTKPEYQNRDSRTSTDYMPVSTTNFNSNPNSMQESQDMRPEDNTQYDTGMDFSQNQGGGYNSPQEVPGYDDLQEYDDDVMDDGQESEMVENDDVMDDEEEDPQFMKSLKKYIK